MVSTTSDWSPYFLDDTPSSRRPWLFCEEYDTIDRILGDSAHITHMNERRHPEEFAGAYLVEVTRGTWGVPRRNTLFTGRRTDLDDLHSRLAAPATSDPTERRRSSVETLEVVGMGGVGKTQLCAEYCYLHYPSYYGLVVWLSAESAGSVVASYRRLLRDTAPVGRSGVVYVPPPPRSNDAAVDGGECDADGIVAEAKARLYRCRVPWLLVFNNLEDRALLGKFLPHGGVGAGHVLITTRSVDADDTDTATDSHHRPDDDHRPQ